MKRTLMSSIFALGSLALISTADAAVSPALYAKQQAAMTYGVNSIARVVNNKVYVPTTTRFDNRAPTYSSSYQNTVYDAQSRGYSMNAAQSLAKNGPSYTSLNYPNKGNAVNASKAPVCSNGKYFDAAKKTWVSFRDCR